MASLTGFETAYQTILFAWLDQQIAAHTEQITSGSALIAGSADQTAVQYAGAVQYLRALHDTRRQCQEIEDQLTGT